MFPAQLLFPVLPRAAPVPLAQRDRQPGYLDADGVRWEDPRLRPGNALLASKGVVLGSILRGLRRIQGRVWQAFLDGLLDRDVLTVALPLYHPRPGGRIDGTRQFFRER